MRAGIMLMRAGMGIFLNTPHPVGMDRQVGV